MDRFQQDFEELSATEAKSPERTAPADRPTSSACERLRSHDFRIDLITSEHPFFSLGKRKDPAGEFVYDYRGHRTRISWTREGRATIWDKDVLIFCASEIIKAINHDREPSQVIVTTKHSLLRSIHRGTSGADYRELDAAIQRLHKTHVETNIPSGGFLETNSFNLLSSVTTTKSLLGDRRKEHVELEVCRWLYRGIVAERVLPLPLRYFNLTGGIERRLFELGRKHCGKQRYWQIGLENLYKKSGSTAPARQFAHSIRKLLGAEGRPILGYHFKITAGNLVVTHA